MISLLSFLSLLAAWALLANIERLPWPPQRQTAMYDQQYWQAVERDTAAYLATHRHISTQIRSTVESMAQTANQKLGGLAQ